MKKPLLIFASLTACAVVAMAAFFSTTSGSTLRFVKDAQGHAVEVVLDQGGDVYTGKKIR